MVALFTAYSWSVRVRACVCELTLVDGINTYSENRLILLMELLCVCACVCVCVRAYRRQCRFFAGSLLSPLGNRVHVRFLRCLRVRLRAEKLESFIAFENEAGTSLNGRRPSLFCKTRKHKHAQTQTRTTQTRTSNVCYAYSTHVVAY